MNDYAGSSDGRQQVRRPAPTGGTATAIDGGYKFTGSSAIDVFNRFSNAYNGRNKYDEWSFSVGQERQGNIGYWQPFDLPNYQAGNGLMEGITKGTRFVNLGNQTAQSMWGNPFLGGNAQQQNGGMSCYAATNLLLGGLGTSVGAVGESLEYAVRSSPNPFSPFKYKSTADAFSRKAYSVIGKEGQTLLKGAKYGGQALGTLGVIVTVADGLDNGWNNHHTADVAIGIATTFFMSGPWGWAAAAVYYGIDAIIQARTGQSITEHVFD